MSLEKHSENISMTDTTHVVSTNKSNEDLYQGGRPSSSVDSQENAATLQSTGNNTQENGSYFNSKKEKFEFTLLIVGIVLSMFMMSLNSTVVAPAMSIIATELNALESQTWIATAYLVALNAFQPLSGRVSQYIKYQSHFEKK